MYSVPRRVRFVQAMAWLFRHWLPIFIGLLLVANVLPVLAPIAMQAGWSSAGQAIYDLYGFISHQRADRSYFLYGDQMTYQLDALPVTISGDFNTDASALKAFRGSDDLGWKMAWSDRLLAMYGSIWLVTVMYWGVSRRSQARRLPLPVAVVLMLPLIVDGTLHYISDFGGVTGGFRYDNAWLVTLTGGVFSSDFYTGAAWGSYNSIMRLLTGLLFGLGFAGYAIPAADQYFRVRAAILREKLAAWRQRQAEAAHS